MVAVVESLADYQCQKCSWELAWWSAVPEVMEAVEAGVLEAPKEVTVAMEEVAVVSFSADAAAAVGDAFHPWAWNVYCSDARIETFAAVAYNLSSCCP